MLSRLAFAALLSSALVSCWRYDPLFCDEQSDCWDNPGRTFCDFDGIYAASEGIARTCIPTPEEAQADARLPDLQVATAVPRVYLQVGKTVSIDVRIQRGIGAEGAVSITVPSPPEGISFDPLAIASDAVTGTLVARAEVGRVAFRQQAITIRAEVGQSSGTADMILDVVGVPGTVDVTHGENGIAYLSLVPDDVRVVGAVAMGADAILSLSDNSLVRVRSDGTLDSSFGRDGRFRVDPAGLGISSVGEFLRIARRSDGNLVVVGYGPASENSSQFHDFFAVLDAQGKLLLGPRRITVLASTDKACAVSVAPDGKLLVSREGQRSELRRYFSDGVPDQAFLAVRPPGSVCAAFAALPDGKVLASSNDADTERLIRFDQNGMLDRTFGARGSVTFPIPESVGLRRIMPGRSGEILVFGELSSLAVWQADGEGVLDESFGPGGYHGFPEVANATERFTDTWYTPEGAIFGVGVSEGNTQRGVATTLVRLRTNGTADEAFAPDGRVIDVERSRAIDAALAVDGRRVLVVGRRDRPGEIFTKKFWY